MHTHDLAPGSTHRGAKGRGKTVQRHAWHPQKVGCGHKWIQWCKPLKFQVILLGQLLQQANKHQLLSQNQLNMVGSEIGCMFCIQRTHTCHSIHIFCVCCYTYFSPSLSWCCQKTVGTISNKKRPCTVLEHYLLSLGALKKMIPQGHAHSSAPYPSPYTPRYPPIK